MKPNTKDVMYLYSTVKQQHKMYWNAPRLFNCSFRDLLNNNIRCIETSDLRKQMAEQQTVKQQHKMYWNYRLLIICIACQLVKQQHKMYWNFDLCNCSFSIANVKQQHKMYQNIDISAKKVGRKIILPTFFYLNKK